MAHVGLARDHLPVAAPSIKAFADLDVEVIAHGAIIAKLCAKGKQHFAPRPQQSSAMRPKTLNQVLAETLDRVMVERGLNNKQLGKMAGVAPNTIGNYRKATGEPASASGKERSAKLAEVERIATALNLNPLYLLTDPAQHAQQVAALAHAVLTQPMPGQAAPPAPNVAAHRSKYRLPGLSPSADDPAQTPPAAVPRES